MQPLLPNPAAHVARAAVSNDQMRIQLRGQLQVTNVEAMTNVYGIVGVVQEVIMTHGRAGDGKAPAATIDQETGAQRAAQPQRR